MFSCKLRNSLNKKSLLINNFEVTNEWKIFPIDLSLSNDEIISRRLTKQEIDSYVSSKKEDVTEKVLVEIPVRPNKSRKDLTSEDDLIMRDLTLEEDYNEPIH